MTAALQIHTDVHEDDDNELKRGHNHSYEACHNIRATSRNDNRAILVCMRTAHDHVKELTHGTRTTNSNSYSLVLVLLYICACNQSFYKEKTLFNVSDNR